MKRFILSILSVSLLVIVGSAIAQGPPGDFVVGDQLPDAPELSPRGEYGVGVQTMTATNPDQIDMVNYVPGEAEPRYDRTMTFEVWYPAIIPDGTEMLTEYDETLGYNGRRDLIPFTIPGRALRDAEPAVDDAAYPLIILSHGYPGSRYMMTYLGENLASKGYVVVAIDHTDSIFSDVDIFVSTLLNRSLDIIFVIDEMERMSAEDSGSFLAGLVDANNTGVVGYSMGGYGAINAAGAGYSPGAIDVFEQFSGGSRAIEVRTSAHPDYAADERIKAVIGFAPWGMEFGLWDDDGLAGLQTPTMFIVGSDDDISGYETGVRRIYEGAVNAERYLLTYFGARHNIAPIAPPPIVYGPDIPTDDFMRYAEPAWSEARMNNINQHFATAFFGIYLKNQDFGAYLDLIPNASDGVWEVDEDGEFTDAHTHWAGFMNRTAIGMMFEQAMPE